MYGRFNSILYMHYIQKNLNGCLNRICSILILKTFVSIIKSMSELREIQTNKYLKERFLLLSCMVFED